MSTCPDQQCNHKAAARKRWDGVDHQVRLDRTAAARTSAAAARHARFHADADAAGITDDNLSSYINQRESDYFRNLSALRVEKQRAEREAAAAPPVLTLGELIHELTNTDDGDA